MLLIYWIGNIKTAELILPKRGILSRRREPRQMWKLTRRREPRQMWILMQHRGRE